jgi:hypothetical protein
MIIPLKIKKKYFTIYQKKTILNLLISRESVREQ